MARLIDDHYAESILGIGYPGNEAQVARGTGPEYRNVPDLMTELGLINSNAYSLWLNDLDAETGSLLFGGVNTEKYIGDLATLPIQRTTRSPTPREFIITLTDLSLSAPDGSNQQNLISNRAEPVLLDSGSSLTYLPDDLAQIVMEAVNAEFAARSRVAIVPCSLAENTTVLNFRFTDPVISVPMNELVLPPTRRSSSDSGSSSGSTSSSSTGSTSGADAFTLADGLTRACLFGIAFAGENPSVLGDTFLRSAYVVYDLDNDEISIAQTNFNSTTDRILEITAGPDAVPNAEPVENPVAAVARESGGARIGEPAVTFTVAGPRPTSGARAGAVFGFLGGGGGGGGLGHLTSRWVGVGRFMMAWIWIWISCLL